MKELRSCSVFFLVFSGHAGLGVIRPPHLHPIRADRCAPCQKGAHRGLPCDEARGSARGDVAPGPNRTVAEMVVLSPWCCHLHWCRGVEVGLPRGVCETYACSMLKRRNHRDPPRPAGVGRFPVDLRTAVAPVPGSVRVCWVLGESKTIRPEQRGRSIPFMSFQFFR